MPYPVSAVRGRWSQNVVGLPAPSYVAGEEGDETNETVVIQFSELVVSATNDYSTGVTIKYDGVPQTINSATRQVDTSVVHYVVSVTGAPNAVVTWEYSDTLGNISDGDLNQMGDISAQTATNNIGKHLRFTDRADAINYFVYLS